MSTSTAEKTTARAVRVRVSAATVSVELADGRTVVAPIRWYPRLIHGSARERSNWTLIGDGEGIHWPDLDEDISVEGLLAGRPSVEGPASLRKWLAGRRKTALLRRAQAAVRRVRRG